jgi:hypothetical protein
MIKTTNFKVEGNHIIFDNLMKKKIKPINCVKLKEGPIPYNLIDNKGYVMRTLLKQSVVKIIIMIQAYKQFEKIKRSAKCEVPLTKILPNL